MKKILPLIIALVCCQLMFSQHYPNGMPMQRSCGTQPPSAEWDAWFNQKVTEYLQNNAGKFSSLNTTAAVSYTIPVIVHVIHGGQAVGTYPNLSNAQVVSQINILTNDFSGTGQYTGNYPATAFANYAVTAAVPAPSYNGTRIVIGNAQLTFLPCQYDKNGNAMPEPGVDRVNFNTFTLTAPYTSQNPANITYSTIATFQNFINNIVKPQTIWDVTKYMNIWTTDQYNSGAPAFNGPNLLGFATFPPGSTLLGIPGGTGTSSTDGLWCWGRAYGNTGFAAAPYNLGRTATHEIGHWLGLRHIWGDGNCVTDYCLDTPPANSPNYVNQNNLASPPTATNANTASYPYKPNTCAGPPANGPNGQMFMNFMDYSDDNAMYMFTTNQVARMQTAMANSPIRNVLGTHGLTIPPPVANFSFTPTAPCAGQTVAITDLSTGGPSAWTYSFTGASIATSTLQNPVVTFTALGTQSITLIAVANGTQPSLPVTKTITVGAGITVNIAATSTAICSGNSVTLTASGATTYSWNTGATSAGIVVSPATTTNYTVTGTSGACNGTRTISINVSATPTLTANNATVCSGSSATLTASGATSYTWNPGNLSGASVIVTPTATTAYTIIGSNGTCTSSITRTVTVNPTPTVTVSATPTTICSGATTTITALGATSYSWNTGALTGGIAVSPTVTTTYTVTGTTSGCSNTKTISISVTSSPTITASSATVCSGNTATLTASGATLYAWNPGNLGGSVVLVTPTATTVYTVTGSLGSCTATTTASVSVNTTPTVNVVASPTAICSGASATLTASGASTYSWNTGATSTNIIVAPSATTSYTVTGTTGSCSNSRTLTLNVTTTPTVTAPSLTICPGNSATLTASGAATYSWNTGATSANIVVTPTVTTVYTVTGFNGLCSNVRTVTVTIGSGLSVAVTPANPSICSGSSASLTASGATSYTWNPGNLIGATVVLSPTVNTTYTVVGMNGACTGTGVVTVSVTNNPTVNVSASPTAICSGSSSTLTASGATTYSWNTGATTAVIAVSPVSTTVYTVTGFNGACGNTKTVTVNVTTTPTVTILPAGNLTICPGGSATISAAGATTYNWNTGATTATIVVSPTVNTVYTVTGTTGACNNVNTITVTIGSGLNIVVTPSNPAICAGGSATITASNANTYTWSTGATGASVVLSPTITSVYTVTGSVPGCSGSKAFTVTVNSNPSATITKTNVTCFGLCNGAISVIGSGATAPYTFSYVPSGPNGLCAGNYTVITLSANGCSTINTVNITQPSSSLSAVASSTAASCGTCATGVISVNANGGTPAYTYTWLPGGMNAATVSNVVPGCYTVTVTDANNCSTITNTCVTFSSGMNELNVNTIDVSIMPNPHNGEFTIQFNTTLAKTIEVFDAIGRLVITEISTETNVSINMANYANGLYYVKVKTTEGAGVYKVLKQ